MDENWSAQLETAFQANLQELQILYEPLNWTYYYQFKEMTQRRYKNSTMIRERGIRRIQVLHGPDALPQRLGGRQAMEQA